MAGRVGCLVFVVGLCIAAVGGWNYIGGGDRRPADGVHLSPDGREIIISGRFEQGLERRFRKLLDASSNARVVRLFSAGGYVKVAGAIRNDIRERRMDTIVSGVCASACTIAFMAGERRLFVKGARLGFHSFTLGGKESDRTTREMELHYGYFGTNQNFIDRIALTPATAIWFPTAEELVNAQVVTEVLAPSSKSRWW